MRKIFAAIIGGAVVVLAVFATQNYLAHFAWEKFNRPVFALRLVRSDAKLAYDIGNYYFGQRDYNLDIAEIAFKKTLLIDPQYFLANYQLARIFFIKGQTKLALEAINRELANYPENRRSYYVRGLINGFSGKLPDAENDFKIFTEWAPTEWAGHNDLSWILAKEGKYEESAENLKKAFENVPNARENVWLQNSLGVAYINLKKYNDAESAFLKAKGLAEKMPLSEWLLAYPGNSEHEGEKGFSTFKSAIEANLSKARYLDNSY